MQRRILFLLGLSLFLSGCGSSSDPAPDPPGALSGNWQMTLTKTDTPKIVKTQSGSLVQNGDLITGSVIFTDTPCSGVGTVSGTTDGSTISLTVDPVGTSVALTGYVSTQQNSMSGNYTILSTGCAGSQSAPQTGIFNAELVTPLSGNLAGTFSDDTIDETYAVTGQVSQGANTGVSSTPLSGSLTFTGFCYADANIVGSISGTSFVMNLVDSDGAQIGQVFGTTTPNATSLTGTYEILGLGTGAVGRGCVNGERGKVSLTVAAQ
jgi:hypothetical protein